MPHALLANVAAAVATVLAAVLLLPQIVRMIRLRTVAGVSVTWAWLGTVTNVAWTVYLVAQGLWWPVPSTVAAAISYAVVAAIFIRQAGFDGRPPLAAAAWAGFMIAVSILGGWVALGLVLGGAYALQVAPSLWTAFRTANPVGISIPTWLITLAEGALWGYHGWWYQDTALIAFGWVASLASVAMLTRAWATRRHLATPASVS